MRRATIGLLVLLLAGAAAPQGLTADIDGLELSSDLRVVVRRGRDVGLEVRVAPRDTYASLARRVAGDPAQAAALEAWNDDRALVDGSWIHVPLLLLSDSLRVLTLHSLFPEDRRDGDVWVHHARDGALPTYDEGLWQVAEWFTGRGGQFDTLMRENGLLGPDLASGQIVRIPAALLHPAFRARERSEDGALEFGSDADGPYASYRIRPGEALYSAVIVRFTGRTDAEDVAALSNRIGERSRIPDAHDIPVGYEIKIPLDLLISEYLPQGHPRRLEAEQRRIEIAEELAKQPVGGTRAGLEGVLVILDPGHGGRDLGTSHNGIWEHDYVYDVTCRLKQMLEGRTSATVRLTLEDRETGCVPSTGDAMVANKQGTILTAPPFLARKDGEAQVGVNLRWYLANSIHRSEVKHKRDPDRIVFVSLHADSRHPSLRGVMVYVPGANYRTRTYGHSSRTYSKYKEVREKPHVRFTKKERLRSEAVSRELAASIVTGFARENLPVQTYQPIRGKIIRGSSQFVPAVLRGNMIPTKVLVEMVNLSNREDAVLLGSAVSREKLARALFRSLFDHFGENPAALRAAAAD